MLWERLMFDQTARFRTIDCLSMIEQRLPALTGASRRVAETIVRDPWAILGMTIYDVSSASGVSLPSVTRFCRAVGYPGFRELVQGVAQSLGRMESQEQERAEDDSDGSALSKLANSIVKRQVDALQTTVRHLDFTAIEQAIAAIATARRVTIVGHGSTYVLALGISVKLNWAGVAASAATPDLFTNQVIAVGPDDVVIGVSHQGRTHDTIDIIRLARSFGATTIGISAVPQSPLTSGTDIAISVLTPEVARAGTFLIAFDPLMVVADILASAVAEQLWGGTPPHRAEVVEWIETNQRVGPTPQTRTPARTRGAGRTKSAATNGANGAEGTGQHGDDR
jgi:DNA-binding MurR/RpiR family transcriptional regulator